MLQILLRDIVVEAATDKTLGREQGVLWILDGLQEGNKEVKGIAKVPAKVTSEL